MKILLAAVNAKYIHSNLAVYSLKAYCREYSCLLYTSKCWKAEPSLTVQS